MKKCIYALVFVCSLALTSCYWSQSVATPGYYGKTYSVGYYPYSNNSNLYTVGAYPYWNNYYSGWYGSRNAYWSGYRGNYGRGYYANGWHGRGLWHGQRVGRVVYHR